MHILVTNDDGPPSPTSSPYVHSLVRELQKQGHTVSVCLPHTQRSWIGKAHMIGQTVKPLYYRPSETFDPSPSAAHQAQGTTYTRPTKNKDEEEWVLVDGTPASCAQIGLYHLFQDKGPVDLVVSGPNYGRNTTAVFALSSGTIGGALEAAVCRRKAIALSYAFFNRNHDPAIIDAASRHSVRVIEKLHAQWPTDKSVDLYTVNVPLIEGIEHRKTLFTNMLQNYWGESGPCFEEVEGSIGDEDEEEERIREGEESRASRDPGSRENGDADEEDQARYVHRHFKWLPRFADVYKSVEEAPPGNDGWAVKEGFTSVTPMKANFWNAATQQHGEELKLPTSSDLQVTTMTTTTATAAASESTALTRRPAQHFYALVAYEDPYLQPLILAALRKVFPPEVYTLLPPPPADVAPPGEPIPLDRILPDGGTPGARVLQITPYEAVDWDYYEHEPAGTGANGETERGARLVNCYALRKAVIRKHFLWATVEQWIAKRPGSALATHVRRSETFELDYAEFLDDALVEAFDLRASLERNERVEEGAEEGQEAKRREKEWWILKPSMSDRGQGIRIFSTVDELQAIFEEWEEGEEGDDDEDGSGIRSVNQDDDGSDDDETGNGITTSHLRHFVAQPYIDHPLLLPGTGNRKFHIRAYVVCVGRLDVYVFHEMLALFAAKPYTPPGHTSLAAAAATTTTTISDGEVAARGENSNGHIDLEAHLTNTCLQRSVDEGTVRRFWDVMGGGSAGGDANLGESLFAQICEASGELFEAAARGMPTHFRPVAAAFEVFGLDFLADAAGTAWLLEANAFPDFGQTGPELRDTVVGRLWEGIARVAVAPRFGFDGPGQGREGEEKWGKLMVHVRHVDLGR
ncbi:sure-like protein [Durotheca rogersii]|uniref:sure-like protein n=1 Tax=Durotheca rogersii TaxID=419775 RepID=UPI00221E4CC3|nr:sure-like protein [Durotheca rogersii]KAI5866373.1 sure-like protein [Durotheca rogersii]